MGNFSLKIIQFSGDLDKPKANYDNGINIMINGMFKEPWEHIGGAFTQPRHKGMSIKEQVALHSRAAVKVVQTVHHT